MSLIEISIRDEGKHWDKTVMLFGIPVYHRHVYEQEAGQRHVGLYPTSIVEVEEEDEYWPEEFKKK